MARQITGEDAVIRAGELYPVEEAKRRLGWGSHAMRTARRAGLPVHYYSGRAFVIGDEVIAFIREQGTSSHRST
jgi:hypothetical protein